VAKTFENHRADGKSSPRSRLPEKPATVALPKMGEKSHSAQRNCIFQNLIADLGYVLLQDSEAAMPYIVRPI
jgi:hypothetical protein